MTQHVLLSTTLHWISDRASPALGGTISAFYCCVPRIDGLPVGESRCVVDDPPCDFVVHIAQRLGVDRDVAQATLRAWLLHYNPKTASPLAIRLASET